MSKTLHRPFGPQVNDGYHIYVSSGGVVTVLGGIGVFAACKIAGVKHKLTGGVSGGSIITAIRALGYDERELVQLGINEDFNAHISAKGGVFGSVAEITRIRKIASNLLNRFRNGEVSQEEFEETWHATGLLGTVGLGDFLKKKAAAKGMSGVWPKDYWTMASCADGTQVVFTAAGVYLVNPKDMVRKLSDNPPPLWTAVRASSAIPIIMTAIEYEGMLLFDGAMTRDGLCPAPVLIRHFGVEPKKVIACRAGEDSNHFIFGPAQRAVRRVWGIEPNYHWGPEGTGVIEFRPQIDHLHALKFQLSSDEKWLAILIAFHACLEALAFNGILSGGRLAEAQTIMDDFGFWRDIRPAPIGSPQLLSERAEKVFAEHGLY